MAIVCPGQAIVKFFDPAPSDSVNTYQLFGHCLGSDLLLPELEPAQGEPMWLLQSGTKPRGEETEVLLGEAVRRPCRIRLYKAGSGYWIEHACTGIYYVSLDGRQIEHSLRPDAHLEAVRIDILGRVMALALHGTGWLCLHGSAMKLRDGVVGFIGPKGYGKSTLASALLRVGAQLASDDLLVLEPGPPVRVLPGVHTLRLRDDSAEHLVNEGISARRDVFVKQVIADLPLDSLMLAPAPLAAIYWLDPAPPGVSDAIVRERLPMDRAAATLVSQGKIARLLGKSETFDVLERALSVCRATPVYRLAVSRDLVRLDTAAAQLLEWHDAEKLAQERANFLWTIPQQPVQVDGHQRQTGPRLRALGLALRGVEVAPC